MIRRKRLTDEEKVAMRIVAAISDLRLDIEDVGRYFAEMSPYVAYNRLQEIAEAAKFYKEERDNVRYNSYTLF